MKIQVNAIMPDDRHLRQRLLNRRTGMIRGAQLIRKCQFNFLITKKAIKRKCQIAVSVKSLHDHEFAVATENEFTPSAWRLNFELQLAADPGCDLNCRLWAGRYLGLRGNRRRQNGQQDNGRKYFQTNSNSHQCLSSCTTAKLYERKRSSIHYVSLPQHKGKSGQPLAVRLYNF